VAFLALLQPDARAAARLSTALLTDHTVEAVVTWHALDSVLVPGRVDGVVVDADHPDREHAVSQIKHLRQRYPELAIVAYAEFRGEEEELYRFGGLGVNGVLPAGRFNDPTAIRTTVDRALAAARAAQVAISLTDTHGELGARAVAWAIEHAGQNPTPSGLAEARISAETDTPWRRRPSWSDTLQPTASAGP